MTEITRRQLLGAALAAPLVRRGIRPWATEPFLDVAKSVTDEAADALGIELGVEELPVRRLEPVEVERQAAGSPVTYLHRGEVSEGRRRRPEGLGGDLPSVDLDAHV